jgi:hypothetical protein
LPDELGLKGESVATKRSYVSLSHPGGYVDPPRSIVTAAYETGAAVAMLPFNVAFNRAMSVSGRPGVPCGDDGVTGSIMLRQRLSTAMRNAELWRWEHYRPHMTLL